MVAFRAGDGRNELVEVACRLVDLAPTLAALLGVAPSATVSAASEQFLARQDGSALHDLLDPAGGRPAHVVGFLLDGCNPNVLYAMADAGEAPNVARLMA